jgi:hypothetical protein
VTLFEAFAALVILGLTAVAYLTLFDGAANAAHRAETSSHLVAYADMALSSAALRDKGASGLPGAGPAFRIERHPWRNGIIELVVTVKGTEGDSVQLRRLVRDR